MPIPPQVITFFAQYWKQFAIVGLAAALYFYVGHLQDEALKWENKYIEQKADFVLLKKVKEENEKLLTGAIENQNAEVEKMRLQLEEKNALITNSNKELHNMQEEHQQEIDDVLDDPEPQSCEKSIEYLYDGAKELGSW